jgi:integrase/recombinase XerD
MQTSPITQGIIQVVSQDYDIELIAEAWLVDCRARQLAPGTIKFYRGKIQLFLKFLDTLAIRSFEDVTPDVIRQYMIQLETAGHSPGGMHAHYRTIRSLINFWLKEVEPAGWRNPLDRIKAPKVPDEPLEPISLDTLQTLLGMCLRDTFHGARDYALLLCLLDSGCRASEFLDLDLADVNQITGEVLIKQGKGHKPRITFLGAKSRKALRAYLKLRHDRCPALWSRADGSSRLTYDGLRAIITRLAAKAGIKPPSLHSFRRGFAIALLRNGADLVSVSRLLGHSSLAIVSRYLKQLPGDLQAAHQRGSPVDRL